MGEVLLERSNKTTFVTTKEWYLANKQRCDFVGTVYVKDVEDVKPAEKAKEKEKI